METLRPLLARLIGLVVAALATWLATKYNILIPDDVKGQVTDAAVLAIVAMFTSIYAVVHRTASIRLNPDDSASPTLADESHDAAKRRRALKRRSHK